MFNNDDNIVAVATTPSNASALNVVRCSGKRVFDIYKKLTLKKNNPRPNSAYLCSLYGSKKRLIDKGVVVAFKGPNSFTGEDIVEYSVHGGSIVLNSLIDELVGLGCRLAEPGEFSYRAFINGKIDLIQAESINSLIKANSNLEAQFSLNSLLGGLSVHIEKNTKKLTNIILHLEHELDFNDNEIDFIEKKQSIKTIEALHREASLLLSSSFIASSNNNISVCLAGKTNVGKSSLFNQLLGEQRAIINREPGTTRDMLSEALEVENNQITLIDTAGVRETANTIEKQGILKTKKAIEKSSVLIFVDDKNPKKEFKNLKIKHQNVLFVHNKKDQMSKQTKKDVVYTSCKNNFGIPHLLTKLSTAVLKIQEDFYTNKSFLLNRRQKNSLVAYLKSLEEAIKAYNKTEDPSIFVNSLYKSLDLLTSTTKPIEKKTLLNGVFAEFCVGK